MNIKITTKQKTLSHIFIRKLHLILFLLTCVNVANTLAQAPDTVIATSPSNISCTSFTANWATASCAAFYFIDVSTNAVFSDFAASYSNTNVGNASTYTITGLAVNTAYYYRVRAGNSSGTSGSSNTIMVNTGAPAAPTVGLVSNINCTSFNANWSTSIGSTGYALDVSTNSAFSTFILGYNNLNAGNSSSTTVSGLTAGTTYYYRVRAYNVCDTSLNSTTQGVVTSSGPCLISAPTAMGASALACTDFYANWGAVTGATTYYIDVSTDIGFATFSAGYNNFNIGNLTTYNITGLIVNTLYYYRIRSSDGNTISYNSSTVAVSTNVCSSVAPIAVNACTITCTSFTANWMLNSGATAYFLDVSTDSTFNSFVTGYNNLNVGNAATSAVTGLMPNVNYFYRIRATDGNTFSPNSDTIPVLTSCTQSAPVADTASTVTCTSFNANWAAASGATLYYLDVSTDSGFNSFVTGYNNINVGTVTTYSITGLSANITYYYRLRASNGSINSVNSNTISVLTCPSTNISELNSDVLHIYPNPVKDRLVISRSKNNSCKIVITDILGKSVKEITTNEIQTEVNVSDIPNGIYFIKMSHSINSHVQKIIVNK
ncbi:MAG: T9SS type A sorting domain-containing protein [Bacteroidota bacterium]